MVRVVGMMPSAFSKKGRTYSRNCAERLSDLNDALTDCCSGIPTCRGKYASCNGTVPFPSMVFTERSGELAEPASEAGGIELRKSNVSLLPLCRALHCMLPITMESYRTLVPERLRVLVFAPGEPLTTSVPFIDPESFADEPDDVLPLNPARSIFESEHWKVPVLLLLNSPSRTICCFPLATTNRLKSADELVMTTGAVGADCHWLPPVPAENRFR